MRHDRHQQREKGSEAELGFPDDEAEVVIPLTGLLEREFGES